MVTYRSLRTGDGILADDTLVPENTDLAAWNDYLAFVDGEGTPDPAPQLAIELERAGAVEEVSAQAAEERLKTLPGGSNLTHWHLRAREAELANVDGTPTAIEYPLLAAEVGRTGVDIAAVATVVVAEIDTVKAAWAAIETVRLTANDSVNSQADVAGIDAALAAIVWP